MNLFPVVILAGGLATRLRPVTEKIPKALVDVGGKPFIAQQLRLLRSQGVQNVIISAWYRGEMIREYVGDGSRFGVSVRYVFDGETPQGTGGAVRQGLPFLDGPFFLLYGDSYLTCDYVGIQAFFMAESRHGLMTVFRNLGKWDASNVEMADGQILQYNKRQHSARMEFIDYGLGLFQPEVFAQLPAGQPADLAEMYEALIKSRQLLAYEVQERFYEVGSFEGWRELDELLSGDPDRFLRKE